MSDFYIKTTDCTKSVPLMTRNTALACLMQQFVSTQSLLHPKYLINKETFRKLNCEITETKRCISSFSSLKSISTSQKHKTGQCPEELQSSFRHDATKLTVIEVT